MQISYSNEIVLPNSLKAFSFRVQVSQSSTKLVIHEIDKKKFNVSVSKSQSKYSKRNLLHKLKIHHSGEWFPPDLELLKKLPLETVSSQLKRVNNGTVAINGGFFIDYGAIFESNNNIAEEGTTFYGDPVGWFRMNGKDLSFPFLDRPALKIKKNGKSSIEVESLQGKKVLFTRTQLIVNPTVRNACDLNKNAYFTRDIQPTEMGYAQYISIVNNKVVGINNSEENIFCPNNGFILGLVKKQKDILIGDSVQLDNCSEYTDIISGGPMLLIDGIRTTDDIWAEEDFLSNFHPKTLTKSLYEYTCARTGVFTLSNGNLLISVCSGRTDDLELCGLTLSEFTEATIEACNHIGVSPRDGMYLDGGACTSFCYKENDIVNQIIYPSGTSNPTKKGRLPGHEAEVGAAIIISTRQK